MEKNKNMNLPKRKSTRLKGYDYSTPGSIFRCDLREIKKRIAF